MLAAFIAQLVEHSFSKRKVHGSTPCGGRKYFFVLRIACPASASDFCFQCVYTHSTSTDSMSSSTQTQCKGTNGSIACQRSWDPQPCRITSVRAAHISVPSFRDRSCFPVWRSSGTSTTDCSKAISVSLQFTTTSNEPRWMSTLCHGIWLLQ